MRVFDFLDMHSVKQVEQGKPENGKSKPSCELQRNLCTNARYLSSRSIKGIWHMKGVRYKQRKQASYSAGFHILINYVYPYFLHVAYPFTHAKRELRHTGLYPHALAR